MIRRGYPQIIETYINKTRRISILITYFIAIFRPFFTFIKNTNCRRVCVYLAINWIFPILSFYYFIGIFYRFTRSRVILYIFYLGHKKVFFCKNIHGCYYNCGHCFWRLTFRCFIIWTYMYNRSVPKLLLLSSSRNIVYNFRLIYGFRVVLSATWRKTLKTRWNRTIIYSARLL